MRVIVVGAGILGMVTSWILARSGHHVVLVDRGPIPNPDSASFDQHRLLHDFESSLGDAAKLMRVSLAGWGELWRDLGHSFVVPSDVLAVSAAEGDLAERSADAFSRAGIDHELLDVQVLQQRYPHLQFPEARFGVLRRKGGLLLAEQLLIALAQRLRVLGTEMMAGSSVTAIDTIRTSIDLASGVTLAGDRIILTAGAWASRIAPKLENQIWAHRQISIFPKWPQRYEQHWRRSPIVVDFGGHQGLWLAPPLGNTELKLAASCHGSRWNFDLNCGRAPSDDEGVSVLGHFARYLTDAAAYSVARAKTCFYSMSIERKLVVERLAKHSADIWVVCGCSGQGFKFAPAIAGLIVGLVEEGGPVNVLMEKIGFHATSNCEA
jgi:sarcosine oxidase